MRKLLALVLAASALAALLGLFRAVPGAHAQQRPRVTMLRSGGARLHLTKRVQTMSQPKSCTVTPDGRHVWVANFGRPDHDNVWVYDAVTLEHVGTVNFPGNAVEFVFTNDSSTAYVSNFRLGQIFVVDAQTYAVRHQIRAGSNPKMMALSPDGATLYAANWSSNDVSTLDVAQRTQTRRMRTGTHPRGMAITREGHLYVASTEDDFIQEFEPDGTEVRRISACRFPRHLTLSPDETQLYVTCSGIRQVVWYDLASGRKVGIAPVGHNPRSLDRTTDGHYYVTADFDSSTVSLIDTQAGTSRVNAIEGADQIVGVCVQPGTGPLRVYATSWNTHELYLLELAP